MSWRVALIDSCGAWPGAVAAAAFVEESAVAAEETVQRCATAVDATGHGSRVARLLSEGGAEFELMLGQVFLGRAPASAAAVAAALDWAVAGGADLIHMSLGLAADRAVLAAAVGRAVGAGCVLVASAPARGGVVYPAAYRGVIRGTGDARCGPGELSCLVPVFFGGCPRRVVSGAEVGAAGASGGAMDASGGADVGGGTSAGVGVGAGAGGRAGASVGAAWVTRGILSEPTRRNASEVIGLLTEKASYRGPERIGRRVDAIATGENQTPRAHRRRGEKDEYASRDGTSRPIRRNTRRLNMGNLTRVIPRTWGVGRHSNAGRPNKYP